MKKPTQAVYVRWLDSTGVSGWSRSMPRTGLECSSIGWLLEEDEDSIVVAAPISGKQLQEDGELDYCADGQFRIPRCAITKMHVWKPPAWVVLE